MGGPDLAEGIYWGDEKWFRDHDFSWFPDDVFKNRSWPFGKPEDHQSVKLTAKITDQVSLKPDNRAPFCQASAVYQAQILNKHEIAHNHIIVKIFMR